MKRSIWILSWITRFSIQMVSALILLTPTVKPTVGKQKDYIANKLSNWEISWEVTRERHAKADARVGGLHARSLSPRFTCKWPPFWNKLFPQGNKVRNNTWKRRRRSRFPALWCCSQKSKTGESSFDFGAMVTLNYKFDVFKIFILSFNGVFKIVFILLPKRKINTKYIIQK